MGNTLSAVLALRDQEAAQQKAQADSITTATQLFQQARQQSTENQLKTLLTNSEVQKNNLSLLAEQRKNDIFNNVISGAKSGGLELNTVNSDGNVTFKNPDKVAIQEKQDQFDQRQWTQFINKVNPATASSRSTLGMTANGNLRANRALATVQNNPVMTYQDLGNVIGDLAGIYQGGAPTDMGMKHQQYDSIQSKIANVQQFLTGKPQDAVPQPIKDKIISVIQGLKDVNNQSLKNSLDSMEVAQKKLVGKFPDEWKAFRDQVESDYMSSGSVATSSSNSTQTFNVGGKTYNIPADKVEAFKKAKGLK